MDGTPERVKYILELTLEKRTNYLINKAIYILNKLKHLKKQIQFLYNDNLIVEEKHIPSLAPLFLSSIDYNDTVNTNHELSDLLLYYEKKDNVRISLIRTGKIVNLYFEYEADRYSSIYLQYEFNEQISKVLKKHAKESNIAIDIENSTIAIHLD
jgi:hypothetical protein